MEYIGLGVITALVAIVAQTGAMFYWGGRISAGMEALNHASQDHEGRLRRLEQPD